MSQPVKLSDALVVDARVTGELTERSIAGQIEFWAGLGKAIEPLLGLPAALALKRAGRLKPLTELVDTVDTAVGRTRVHEYLETVPFPHYQVAPDGRGLLRIDADGTKTLGRFVNRQFQPRRKPRRSRP
jgi:hypothetical protein